VIEKEAGILKADGKLIVEAFRDRMVRDLEEQLGS